MPAIPQAFESDERVEIETPEHIAIEYELAGLGSRFIAVLFDGLIQVLLVASLALIAWVALTGAGALDPESPNLFIAFAVIGIFLITMGYHLFFEATWSGQTPGKRAVSIRVVRDEGLPISFWDSAVRNLVRLVDMLPMFYAVGLLTAFISRRAKRLGDYAAGTMVVLERTPVLPQPLPLPPPLPVASPAEMDRFAATYAPVLTPAEVAAISRFLARRRDLEPEARFLLSQRLVRALADRLPLDDIGSDWRQNEAILEALGRQR